MKALRLRSGPSVAPEVGTEFVPIDVVARNDPPRATIVTRRLKSKNRSATRQRSMVPLQAARPPTPKPSTNSNTVTPVMRRLTRTRC